MTYEEIQKRVNDLSAAMLAKGMSSPSPQAVIKSHAEPMVYMSWEDKSTQYGSAYEGFSAKTFSQAFSRAESFVASRPSAEQAKLNEFLGALGKVIDLGRQNEIEVEFLNPLVASMKKLSENVITFQKDAE